MKKNPLILGIESSCDDTCAAVIRGRELLSSEIISSAAEQAKYGGVVPEIASRAHTDAIGKAVEAALKGAGAEARDLDAVAVTYGAGLLGALLVGLSFAKGFAYALGIPLIAVSHIRGHLAAPYLDCPDLKPPYISLLASGGHTAILYCGEDGYEALGSTCDDAAGEAFDKCARVLSLPYPGGPNIERLAKSGEANIPFPPALSKNGEGLRFTYSGLKTSVLNYCNTAKMKGEIINCADVAASFQRAALEPLVSKTVSLAKERKVSTVCAGGGVVANGYLRERLQEECKKAGLKLVLPEKKYCTDNAAMIAAEGYLKYLKGEFAPLSVNAAAQVSLE